MSTRFPSHVSLPDQTKAKLCASGNTVLASTLDLYSQVKQAHWNIKGPQFFARHELFDKLALRLVSVSDDVAERIATLGGYAEGTTRMAGSASELPEYDSNASDGRAHIRALVERYATYTKLLRRSLDEADDIGDPVTADLYTEVTRGAELDMWFLESHLMS